MHLECLYFRAHIPKSSVVTFTALIRSMEDHMVFDRIDDPTSHIFEFFVPIEMEGPFLKTISFLEKENLCFFLKKYNILQSSVYNNI